MLNQRGDSVSIPLAKPVVPVVMGVSGSGKTTVASILAGSLGWPFEEGDALHPRSNIEKMKAGHPLTDADRQSWLAAVAEWVERRLEKTGSSRVRLSSARTSNVVRRDWLSSWLSDVALSSRTSHAVQDMKLYDELAEWWPVFSDPKEYRREAAYIRRVLRKSTRPAPLTVLELGSGGGNSAFHLKAHFVMTLVDLSPRMLLVSRKLNPECEHIKGDIRTLRLGRTFDVVFVHDAICHMTTEPDLRAVMQTAYEHCRPGGVALFVPDFVRETFLAGTDEGGTDGLRFLQWVFDPDPTDTTYLVDFAILLRNQEGEARVVHDRHVQGLFPRAQWLHMLREVGLKAVVVKDDEVRDLFLGRRPLQSVNGAQQKKISRPSA